MESKEQSKALLVNGIEEMKKGQFEEMFLMSFYGLSSYFKSLMAFGSKSDVTKDNLNVIREMFKVVKTERLLLNFILKNVNNFNIDAAQNVVDTMDELNDKTIEFYYSVIDEIEDAVDMNEERRGIRPRKNFSTLIQTDTYTSLVVALAENKDSVRSFLGFEDEFWEYIGSCEHSVEVPSNIAEEISYVTALLDHDGNVSGIKMLVPEVIDLNTALLAIRCYVRAHSLYGMLGKPLVTENVDEYVSLQDLYKHKLSLKSTSILN